MHNDPAVPRKVKQKKGTGVKIIYSRNYSSFVYQKTSPANGLRKIDCNQLRVRGREIYNFSPLIWKLEAILWKFVHGTKHTMNNINKCHFSPNLSQDAASPNLN